MTTHWLNQIKTGSKDQFHNWLMEHLGFETYLKNKLWDSTSLLHYITVVRRDNLYLEFQNLKSNLIEIDFSKREVDAK